MGGGRGEVPQLLGGVPNPAPEDAAENVTWRSGGFWEGVEGRVGRRVGGRVFLLKKKIDRETGRDLHAWRPEASAD